VMGSEATLGVCVRRGREGLAWDVYSSVMPRIEVYCLLIAGSPESLRFYRPRG
jgi:hypothetical protein